MPRNEKTQTLVIVESPTKAKTIRKFLPPGYRVEASMGHVRDLPTSAAEIPEKVKKESWARLGVNVDNGFEPLYVVPKKKTKVVSELKSLLKEADQVLLATDEDREGESISWHLLEVLKPKVPYQRMVFHEITRDAIRRALEHPRDLDERLVRAQETRRILDRLVGYGLSPLLWKKIAFGLSAGRVQSVAVDVIVRRERERMAFRKATYWDLLAKLAKGERFDARLVSVGKARVASGKDFDEKTGALKGDGEVIQLDEAAAKALVGKLKGLPFTVLSVEEKPVTRRPPPPLITSTMQQEANRKLGMSAQETMRVAQSLYERGLITYMRTDSVHLSNEAIQAARSSVEARFGKEFLSPGVRQYKTSTKGAQEAHEAIRPSADFTAPKETGLTGRDYDLYELIWMRTIATQMADAQQTQISVRIGAGDSTFAASGMRIVFPGFLRAYVEGSDDAQAALEERERLLPAMKQGDVLALVDLLPEGHETKPPPRFTEASLIQFMEKEGIGRPSTFASIVSTIIDRGYVVKQGNQLVPTFTGFVVTDLLENHFPDLVDVGFTSQMEQSLDAIAEGQLEPLPYLNQFFLGDRGLKNRIENQEERIDPRDAKLVKLDGRLGGQVEIHVGKFGPYLELKTGDGEPRKASIPEDVAPGDLSLERVEEILEKYERREQGIGVDPKTGKPVFLKTGSYGPYVQLGDATDEEKPKRASLPPGIQLADVDLPLALRILELPRLLGTHPQTGKEIRAGLGRFGPYVVHDGDFRSLKKEDDILTVGLDRALELLAQPKGRGRGAAVEPLKTVGKHPTDGEPVFLYSGRYGYYVKHGEKTATVGKGEGFDPEKVTLEQSVEALANAPEPKKKKGRAGGTKAASAKSAKAAAEKPAAKKAAGAKKTAAKSTTAKKPAVRKRAGGAEAESAE